MTVLARHKGLQAVAAFWLIVAAAVTAAWAPGTIWTLTTAGAAVTVVAHLTYRALFTTEEDQ